MGRCQTNEKAMSYFCKQTCGFCEINNHIQTFRNQPRVQRRYTPKPSPKQNNANTCADKSENCKTLVEYGWCQKRKAYMENLCSEACGFCGNNNRGSNTVRWVAPTRAVITVKSNEKGNMLIFTVHLKVLNHVYHWNLWVLKSDLLKKFETDLTISTKRILSCCCGKTKLLEFLYVLHKFWAVKITVKYLLIIICWYISNILPGRILEEKLLMGIGKSFAIDLYLSSPSQVKYFGKRVQVAHNSKNKLVQVADNSKNKQKIWS